MRTLKNIKVGDRVWVKDWHGRGRIQPVARLTPKLIILDGHYTGGAKSEFNRYHRGKPSKHDGELSYWQYGGTGENSISAIATRAQCVKWDAEQEEKRVERENLEAANIAREKLRQELLNLFPAGFYIQETHNNLAGEWQVYVYTTEQGVRNLAALIGANII